MNGNYKESSTKAMLAIDGAAFDQIFMDEEEASPEIALMAFSDSEIYVNGCSKSCSTLKELKELKAKYDSQRVELNETYYNLQNHKRGLVVVEEQLVFYRQNEAVFTDDIAGLRRDLENKNIIISVLKEDLAKKRKMKIFS